MKKLKAVKYLGGFPTSGVLILHIRDTHPLQCIFLKKAELSLTHLLKK